MRKNFNKILGNIGEFDAKRYLIDKGYSILQTNYSNNIGEIDIIAKQKKTIVFVEVKMRETLRFGRPCQAVTPCKQQRIRKCATFYLMQHKMLNSCCRFDVIEVFGDQINHIENAF